MAWHAQLIKVWILLLLAIKLSQRMEAAALLTEALILPISAPESSAFQVLLTDSVPLIVVLFPAEILAASRNLRQESLVCQMLG